MENQALYTVMHVQDEESLEKIGLDTIKFVLKCNMAAKNRLQEAYIVLQHTISQVTKVQNKIKQQNVPTSPLFCNSSFTSAQKLSLRDLH